MVLMLRLAPMVSNGPLVAGTEHPYDVVAFGASRNRLRRTALGRSMTATTSANRSCPRGRREVGSLGGHAGTSAAVGGAGSCLTGSGTRGTIRE